MELGDFSKPGEKKKLVAAGVLGLVAILFLWWTFIGFGKSTPVVATKVNSSASPTPTPRGPGMRPQAVKPPDEIDDLASLSPIRVIHSSYVAPEARRNIFAYYEPPPTPSPTPPIAAATPVPTPPILLAAISPSNVYASTGDFTLEASGDKFTSEMRIYLDNTRELPTKYIGPQQMSATVAAALIGNPQGHQVVVRTPDGRAYSNPVQLMVNAPPTPNYSYIGIYSTQQRAGDLAYLQDRANKDIVSVQRGDVVSGRFRVTSISEKEIVLTDTRLTIRHKIAMTEGEKGANSPLMRPTPRVDSEDDEP